MELLINYGIDVILAVLFIATVIGSAQKGFFKCVLSLICTVAALFAALSLSQPAAEIVYDNILEEKIVDEIQTSIGDKFNPQTAVETVKAVIEMIPEYLLEPAKDLGVDIQAVSDEISGLKLSAEDTALELSKQVIRPGALVLLKLVCYILIYLIVRTVLGWIVSLFNNLPAPKLFKKANKLLGAGLGAVKGVVIVLMLSFAVNALAAVVNDGSDLDKALDSSRICAVIREFDAKN